MAGVDYPGSTGEFRAWFSTDAACLDYLEWVRWPSGFVCPDCGGRGWAMRDGRFKCSECGLRVSVTAGTMFEHARTPLTVWFELCWRFTTSKQGVSALEAARDLGIGSYRTAWGMCQRLRQVVVRPGREKLSGVVEADEAFVGGVERGLPGGRARGNKSIVCVAVESGRGGRLGRARVQVVPDASAATLGAFLLNCVEPGSTIVTDAWKGYSPSAVSGYTHIVVNQAEALRRGADPDDLLPGVNRVVSLLKRWLLATHQGAVSAEHLQEYLDEWVFRFNRRTSRRRGLLFYRLIQLAVGHEPVPYASLIRTPGSGHATPAATTRGRGGRPASFEPAGATYPWRGHPTAKAG